MRLRLCGGVAGLPGAPHDSNIPTELVWQILELVRLLQEVPAFDETCLMELGYLFRCFQDVTLRDASAGFTPILACWVKVVCSSPKGLVLQMAIV